MAVMLIATGTVQAAGAASAPGFTSAESRLSIWNGSAAEHHLWRLKPGGRAEGRSFSSNLVSRGHYIVELSDTGAWTYQNGVLCVTWSRLLEGGRHCFRLSVTGTRLRAVSVEGGRTSRGTLHPLAAKYRDAPK